MKQTRKIIAAGIFLGVLGAFGQIWFMRSAAAYAPLARGVLFIGVATFIGLFAAFSERNDRIKAAALGGFVVGFIQSWSVGLFSLDRRAFLSVETALTRVSAILVVLVLTSWVVAGLASVAAFPIAQVLSEKE